MAAQIAAFRLKASIVGLCSDTASAVQACDRVQWGSHETRRARPVDGSKIPGGGFCPRGESCGDCPARNYRNTPCVRERDHDGQWMSSLRDGVGASGRMPFSNTAQRCGVPVRTASLSLSLSCCQLQAKPPQRAVRIRPAYDAAFEFEGWNRLERLRVLAASVPVRSSSVLMGISLESCGYARRPPLKAFPFHPEAPSYCSSLCRRPGQLGGSRLPRRSGGARRRSCRNRCGRRRS